ncbi:viral RNA helicase/ superfamily I [Synechococcus sp. BIOS-U3-1]|uniref:RNA helicase n=1 Tax=Synechococcus sp. BIOS-U3-1 TaxID=1400865 RepID=UPI0016461EFC|nr:RNA helicase [Synechococcus sp. BIOS-U3-1]QNI60189.1 viral RNA helicase/ superfamily I [Synechococcus sp. BIOS-U3-1]
MDSRRQRSQRSPDPLDRRLDRWLDTGRQLVDGVSGARPGRRSFDRLDGASRLDAMGRWVGDRIDWLLDEEDDWRELSERPQSLQSARQGRADVPSSVERSTPARRKRPLQALSRRQPMLPPPVASTASMRSSSQPSDSEDVWPEDDSFRVERWKRSVSRDAVVDPGSSPTSSPPTHSPPTASSPTSRSSSRRSLPRSSRRRD